MLKSSILSLLLVLMGSIAQAKGHEVCAYMGKGSSLNSTEGTYTRKTAAISNGSTGVRSGAATGSTASGRSGTY